MSAFTLREKLIEEVQRIPENKIEELYDFVHHFRVGLESTQGQVLPILKFAGCWNEMPEEIFAEFLAEISPRRQQAFLGRRSYATGAR
jgi:hypothetical protein